MNNNIQCSIESSTTKIELNSAVDGVFLVPELEGLVGLPEIRTTSGVNAGYDGGWTSAQNYDARLISIRGVIANPDISKVEDKRRAIASLLGQGRKEQLTLRFTTEAGNAYAISVRTISCEMALQRVLTTQEFLIQLRADDPLIYDDGTTGGIAAILQPQRALGGFEINFGLPLAIGGGAEDTVVDNGNETVYPVIKLYGALHSPTVVNRTTNQQMQILADLQYSIDWHTYRSATGDYILVNGGLNGAPMTLSQLLGNAEQTTYSGKNLLNDTTAQRTIPSSGNFNATIPITIGAGTYSFGAFADGVFCPEANYYVFQFRNGSTPIVQSSTPPTPMTLTAQEASQVDNMFLYFNANFTGRYGGKHLTAMVCSGSTLGDYEPYTGSTSSQINPSPNPDYPQPISTVTGAQTVQVTGKNLLDTSDPHDKSGSGMTATWNNGVVEVKGTNTATSFPLSDNIALPTQIKAGTEISASFVGASIGNTVFRFFNQAIGQYESLAVANPNTSGTYTLTRDADAVQLYKGGVPTNTYKEFSISNWQIEYGSTATTYEPYDGTQSYEVNLGKNLLPPTEDWSQTINGVAIDYEDGIFTLSGTATANTVTTLRTATAQYTIRDGDYIHYNNSFASTQINIQFYFTDGTSFATSMNATNRIFPIDIYNGTSYVGKTIESYRLNFNSGNAFNGTVKPMIVHNVSTPTSFVPYTPPIELAKVGTYQDRIYKNDGKWYIEKQVGKVVLDGTENITVYNTKNSILGFRLPVSQQALMATMPLCDYFQAVRMVVFASDDRTYGTIAVHNSQTVDILYASAPNSSITTADGFKTWLSAHNTTVYYALATPTTTEITDETLLSQLNFLASLYEGENNISLVGTGAQGEMTVRYATDYTVNQDIITIDSQARTITLNGQDVYHLKTSESEFLVLAPGENKLYLTSEVSDDSGYAEVKFKQGYLSI